MKIGVLLPLFANDPHVAIERARRAEKLGFDGLFAFDHLLPLGGPADAPSLEAFAMLSAAAAVTTRPKIGTLVTRVTLRRPAMLAKQLAALDAMSAGRAIAGIGTGDEATRPEAEAFGLALPPPAERRRLLEETVLACKALFRGEPWPGGELVPAMQGPISPPPISPGGPPMWLGGTSEAVVRLAAKIGDGWNGWGLAEDRFADRARTLFAAAEQDGREVEATWAGLALVGSDASELERLVADRRTRGLEVHGLWIGTADELVESLRTLAGAGASWGVLMLAGPADRIDLVGEHVLPSVRAS